MIAPHIVQGGASSWFCDAGDARKAGRAAAAGFSRLPAHEELQLLGLFSLSFASDGSGPFTPTRYCASRDMNLLASHLKT